MINISALMRLVGNYEPMNEVSIKIPSKGKGTTQFKIEVRSRAGGGGHAGNVSQHGCSIKLDATVGGSRVNIPLIIPNGPYEKLSPKVMEKVQSGISTMYKRAGSNNVKLADACLQFAYDNQAVINMLWDCDNAETSPEGIALISFMENQAQEIDYFSTKRKSWKSEEEYNADVAKINTYVKDHIKKMKESK